MREESKILGQNNHCRVLDSNPGLLNKKFNVRLAFMTSR